MKFAGVNWKLVCDACSRAKCQGFVFGFLQVKGFLPEKLIPSLAEYNAWTARQAKLLCGTQ